MKRLSGLACMLLLFVSSASSAQAGEQDLIRQMQSGSAVLMIRHALAPGVGDPDDFNLDDCSTQRNLNQAGREQAKAIGHWLRSRGIGQVKLYSSQWCRCLETARLMQMGTVTPLPALNSFFQRPEDREPNLSSLRKFIHENTKPGELIIMITHQVTISAITGQWADSGHGKLLRPTKAGGIALVGELSFEE
ncbi:MAG: histidine phosphatase family protein [Gammaproteobacteria bacterium]